MRNRPSLRWLSCGLVLCLLAGLVRPAIAALPEFRVSFTREVRSEPYSGRVYLFFTRGKNQEPRSGPNWFNPEPLVAVDVQDWQPGAVLTINSATPQLIASPRPAGELDVMGLRVQAVARFIRAVQPGRRGGGGSTTRSLTSSR